LKSELDVISQELENMQQEEQTLRSKATHTLSTEQVNAATSFFVIDKQLILDQLQFHTGCKNNATFIFYRAMH